MSSDADPPAPASLAPSVNEIRSRTLETFGKRPCLWQVRICEAILKGDQDVISIAGTGMGKTLTFWMPLLFRPLGILLVVTPLNILGKQNIETLEKAGIEGIFISARTATEENFRAIAAHRYRVIVVNPEELMRPKGGFEKLMKDKLFVNSLIGIVIDEAHCISQWGSFRPEYRHIGQLRFLPRKHCPYLITSATMSPAVILDIKKVLNLDEDKLLLSRCSVNRSNFAIIIRPIVHSLASFLDLKFLLRDWKPGDPPPPKFLVFFDNIQTAVSAAKVLRKLLPKEHRHRVKWFFADMSDEFKEDEADRLAKGETWGLLTTDSFGMGMDIPDIQIVCQWRATLPSVSTIWQRFGRCVRDPTLQGLVYLFVEKEYFDAERKRAETAKDSRKRKRAATVAGRHSDPSGDEEEGTTQMKSSRKPKNGKKNVIDPAVDDVINADERGIGCRRQPLIAVFQDSMSATSHLECDPALPQGCARCRPVSIQLCCDIHNPELTQPNISQSSTAKPQAVVRRSNLSASLEMDSRDKALEYDLEIWRRNKTKEKYGLACLKHEGPGLVMSAAVRERIVKCAHFGKIKMATNLERETRWSGSHEYGCDIIKIIEKHYPPEPPPSLGPMPSQLPLQPFLLNSASQIGSQPLVVPPAARTKRAVKCSVCNQTGHNMKNKAKCPGPPSTQFVKKENIPPLLPSPLPRDPFAIPSLSVALSSSTTLSSISPFSSHQYQEGAADYQ
ncbi:P-loop containing nucleoside triphosphate hydrolase protein [Amanita rubescens]|nr:P-loop containing nucleoside triphosphate hydrolase protein [Amanita rubescens]